MAVIVEMVMPGLTEQQYDELREVVGWLRIPPEGGIAHLVWWEDDGCHAIDVFESVETFSAFGQERLAPVAAKLGIPMDGTPVFHQPHEIQILKKMTET